MGGDEQARRGFRHGPFAAALACSPMTWSGEGYGVRGETQLTAGHLLNIWSRGRVLAV